jgi:hypothetical protein
MGDYRLARTHRNEVFTEAERLRSVLPWVTLNLSNGAHRSIAGSNAKR